jgi:hypothetical protein
MPSVDEIVNGLIQSFGNLPPGEYDRLSGLAREAIGNQIWIPNIGPQTQAYFSLADWMLYGGQAGGGKTSLLLGLALTAHHRSLIMRRRYTDLNDILEEAIRLNGTRNGFNGSIPQKLRTADDRLINFGAAANPGSEESWQGQAHDLLAIDEVTQFLESQVRFLMGWVRSTKPGQRCRTVFASNPPISASGDWIIGMFRPWLDVTHPNPAKSGELRWYIVDGGKDYEVDGPEPIERNGQPVIPLSRTFIPAALKDNPYLINTGYQAKLDAFPEPLRSAMRDGNFMAARQDQENQVIPLEWVLAAEQRWTPDGGRGVPMTACGYDASGGGADPAALAVRHDAWYGPVETLEGPGAADGITSFTFISARRRDNAAIVIDVGGGYGGATIERFKDNDIPYTSFNGANAGYGRTRDRALRFANKRAEAMWRFREALDPDQPGGSIVALPHDPELRSDLTAPTFTVGLRGIQIEKKEDIKERLGRSTNKGDAVIMALSEGQEAIMRGVTQRRGERRPSSLPARATTRGGPLARRHKKTNA